MKIIFLGTPEFAVASLQAVIEAGFEVVAVVTAPDKQAGRGLKLKASAVKQFAISNGIPVLQPLSLKDRDFIQQVNDIAPDLMIVVAFRMMPEVLWNLPKLGTFNLHGSLLPQYRGAAPIQRALMNGETVTGVTTFFLRQEIDTGNILFRTKVNIAADDTGGSLHDKLMTTGAALVVKTVQAIDSGNINTTPQEQFLLPGETLHTAPKIFPADCKADWTQQNAVVYNLIRALDPYPGAFTQLRSGDTELQMKMFSARPNEVAHREKPGTTFISDGLPGIYTSDGSIIFGDVQLQGKKRMSGADFLRGFRDFEAFAAT